MNTADVNAVLDRAIELLQQGWCQHHGARTAEGDITDAEAQDAARWCVTGALWRAVAERHGITPQGFGFYGYSYDGDALWQAAVYRVAEQLGVDEFMAHRAVTNYNDDDRRSAEDVILTVKQARED